ncbi:MAG: sugar phosphate nucleotidyltransferase [Pseudomonadota bacterium]
MIRTGMILAAGYGTRMRPLTDHLAKPLLPVGRTTLLERTLSWMAAGGLSRVVLNLHHLPDQVRAYAEAVAPEGLELLFSHEEEILGSGGGIGKAATLFRGEHVLVVNGDVLFDLDPGPFFAAHVARDAAATTLVIPAAREPSLATVTLDDEDRVTEITREGAPQIQPGRRGIFSGIHLLAPALHRLLPGDRFASVVTEGYRPFMTEGRVFGHYVDAPWWDLGTPERYEAAVKEFLTGSLPPG